MLRPKRTNRTWSAGLRWPGLTFQRLQLWDRAGRAHSWVAIICDCESRKCGKASLASPAAGPAVTASITSTSQSKASIWVMLSLSTNKRPLFHHINQPQLGLPHHVQMPGLSPSLHIQMPFCNRNSKFYIKKISYTLLFTLNGSSCSRQVADWPRKVSVFIRKGVKLSSCQEYYAMLPWLRISIRKHFLSF